MPIKHDLGKAKLWIDVEDVEQTALDQIKTSMEHPKLYKYIAIMPDVHMGIGCTIGSVIPIEDGIIPACVGVDIGCGMASIKTSLREEDFPKDMFETLHKKLSTKIPMGFSHRGGRIQLDEADTFLLARPDFKEMIKLFQSKYPDKEILPQLGTLGGGNHFIELQCDKDGNVWIMVHSGSRNIGNLIARKYISKAKELNDPLENVPTDMEYLHIDSSEGEAYIEEMTFAVQFARTNRYLMLWDVKRTLEGLFPRVEFDGTTNIPHNYSALEEHFGKKIWVHRKGATKATSDQLGIIPGSMGGLSYIVRGKDNPDSFMSCSHGAGRKMSRTAARGKYNRKKKEFKTEGLLSVDGFESDMIGVFSKDIDRQHLDEAPGAYKDIAAVMDNQTDLVDIEVELRPIFNMKG